MVGAAEPVEPGLVAAETQAREEFDAVETEIRKVAAAYLKQNTVTIAFEIGVSQTNRIDMVNEELKKSPGMFLLVSNYQSYSEISGGLIGYPNNTTILVF